jgi:NTE family protein
MPRPDPAVRHRLADGFTLALGGGGARGWAHIGVARALERADLRPTRLVGTSMGAIVAAGIAAGHSSDAMERAARSVAVLRELRRPGRLALFDARAMLHRLADDLRIERIEALPLPLGITTYDLVSGRPRLLTEGPIVPALERSIAVPFFLPPHRDAEGVWCDAGPWEGIPVSLARAWAPDLPIVGVLADIPKPAFLSSPIGAAVLRRASARLRGRATAEGERLTARRFLALVAERWADPVVREPPDVLVELRLGRMNALQFGRVGPAIEAGERDTHAALATIGVPDGPAHRGGTDGS